MSQTDSFAEVYRHYFPAAAGLARSLARDDAVADDIAAEGLLRIWPHWDAGTVSQPWGYIRKTIVNQTITRTRKRAREEDAVARLQAPADARFEDAVGDRDLVHRLLDQLPPRQRQILVLRFLADLSEHETALRLGISVGAVKSGTSRGLARLRDGLASNESRAA